MSGITGIGSNTSSLLTLLSQSESGQSDSALLNSLASSGLQTTITDAQAQASAASSGTATESDLQKQIQSAVTAALQNAEQSGGSDLKGVVYNALVQVLNTHGIDPKSFQSTTGSGDTGGASSPQKSLNSATSNVLSQVLAALSSASNSSNPLTQRLSSQDSSNQGSNDLLSLLSDSQDTSQSSKNVFSPFIDSQNNNQDLLGFLYDSGP